MIYSLSYVCTWVNNNLIWVFVQDKSFDSFNNSNGDSENSGENFDLVLFHKVSAILKFNKFIFKL